MFKLFSYPSQFPVFPVRTSDSGTFCCKHQNTYFDTLIPVTIITKNKPIFQTHCFSAGWYFLIYNQYRFTSRYICLFLKPQQHHLHKYILARIGRWEQSGRIGEEAGFYSQQKWQHCSCLHVKFMVELVCTDTQRACLPNVVDMHSFLIININEDIPRVVLLV